MGNARIVGCLNHVMKIKMPGRSTANESHEQNVEWKEVDIKESPCDVSISVVFKAGKTNLR